MKLMKRLHSKDGFTLVELLTVICILVLLMSASFGALTRARELAKVSKASAQLRELVNAWTQYYTTYWAWPDRVEGAKDEEVTDKLLGPIIDSNDDNNEYGIVFLSYTPGAGKYYDPWGSPYRLSFGRKGRTSGERGKTVYETTISIPKRSNLR